MTSKLPNGKIKSVADLGRMVRMKRKQEGVTQFEFAGLMQTGNRFISELENGKETIQLGKVIKILHGLGLELVVQPRQWWKK